MDESERDEIVRAFIGCSQVPLSPREYAIVECLSLGLSGKAIAAKLGITKGTIKVYTSKVSKRLGITREGFSVRLRLALDFHAGRFRLRGYRERVFSKPPKLARQKPPRPVILRPIRWAPEVKAAIAAAKAPISDRPARARISPHQRAEMDRWDRIFNEKFADPSYYSRPATVRMRSPLSL